MMKSLRRGKWLLTLTLIIIVTWDSTGAAESAISNAPITRPTLSAKTRPSNPSVTQSPAWYNPYPNYYSIKMTSASAGWIVASDNDTNPRIKRYFNGSWVDYPIAITNTGRLNAVDANASEAWIVGEFGTILHWQGGDWVQVSSPAPVTTTLVAVSIVAPHEAWAIGNLATYQPPVILHYHDGSWTLAATPVISSNFELRSMSWTSPTDGWLVGDTFDQYGNNHQPIAFHYVSGSWVNIPLPHVNGEASAVSIYMLGAGEGWIGLSGNVNATSYSLLHYAGGVWQPIPAGGNAIPESTNAVISFASGDYYRADAQFPPPGSQQNYFSHNQSNISTAVLLTRISGVAANDIWGIGEYGNIYHWDGVQLTPVEGGARGGSIQMLNSDDGWMTGTYGAIPDHLYHYTAGYWSPTGIAANTFGFDRPDDGWAQVPISGSVYGFSHYDGIGWGHTQNPTDRYYLSAMQIISSTSGWAVGSYDVDPNLGVEAPAVAQFSMGSWQAYTLDVGINAQFLDASFTSEKDGWAVGYQGSANYPSPLIYHYSNGNWQYVTPPPNLHIFIHSVSALAPDNVWMVGLNDFQDFSPSYILHWDGSNWTVQSYPATVLHTIKMLSPTEGWVVGYSIFLHYVGGSWQQMTVPQESYGLSFVSPTEGWAAGVNGPWRYASRCLDYYSDIPSGYWASSAILALSCGGVVSGTGNHQFSPNATATRAQFARMLTLGFGWPLITPPTPTFSDVLPGYFAYSFIETAHARGIISGYGAAQCQAEGRAYPCFGPNDAISRAQLVLIAVKAKGWALITPSQPTFSDVAVGAFAYAEVETAVAHGVISGFTDSSSYHPCADAGTTSPCFLPTHSSTRAQLASIFYNTLTASPMHN